MVEIGTPTSPPGEVDLEEWFLSELEKPELHVEALLEFLAARRPEGHAEQSKTWCDLLLDEMIERGDHRGAIAVISERFRWAEADEEATARCEPDVIRALEKARDLRVLPEAAGFGSGLDESECLRRLNLLLDLRPDCLCYDKTWGFGQVRRVDYFYKRVEIDFEKKHDHHMSMAYAAETLDLIGEDHILARQHNHPEEVEDLVRTAPADIVRISLRSYGPMSVPVLQEKLVPALVAEADWKRFWDGARKELKGDPLVEIPTKRSAPIQLLDSEKSFDHEWFTALASERNLEAILSLLDALTADEQAKALVVEHSAVVLDRMAFVINGAEPRQPGLTARVLLLAQTLGLDRERLDAEEWANRALDAKRLRRTVRQLPAKLVRPFLDLLAAHDEARLQSLLTDLIPEMEMGLLNEATLLLRDRGYEEACAEVFRRRFAEQTPSVEMVNWVVRNLDRLTAWQLGDLPGLMHHAMNVVEQDLGGERLRAQNQLRDQFQRGSWFRDVLSAMRDSQRRDLVHRLKDTPGFSSMDRRALIGKAIKRHPELQEEMKQRGRGGAARSGKGRLTSIRSYRERQAQLEQIVNVAIPENSREIGVARSYGDLRENHEYKAAKEMQGILLRRQAELEKMLTAVKPSEFRNMPADVVGPATGVELTYPDGQKEFYYILGEWDRDEKLNIIASTTRMAKALEGYHTGAEVIVPTEFGESSCTITRVEGLSDAIYAWIEGADTADDAP